MQTVKETVTKTVTETVRETARETIEENPIAKKDLKSTNERIVCEYISSLGELLTKCFYFDVMSRLLSIKLDLLEAFKILVRFGWTVERVRKEFSCFKWYRFMENDVEIRLFK